MNMFLLSMIDGLNAEIKKALQDEISKRGNRVAYVSSEPQSGEKPYYLANIKDFKVISDEIEVDYFDLSDDFSDELLNGLSTYGVVYLAGGNTYTFLAAAKKRNLQNILEHILDKDGLLIGVSAGALIMTPSVELAASENLAALQDSSGFAFVPFEFFPHYEADGKEFPVGYLTKNTIYLCKNGDGIFVSGNGMKKFGDIRELETE